MAETTTTRDIFTENVGNVQISSTVLPTARQRYTPKVEPVVEPIRWMATAIESAISDASYREPKPILKTFTDEDGNTVVEMASIAGAVLVSADIALGARFYQVNQYRTKFDKKNFEYVALIGPILGAYGVYHDSREAYDIVPQLGDELRARLKAYGCIEGDNDSENAFIIPEWYSDLMFMFRRYGLMTGYGLPRQITVDSNTMYQIAVENGIVVGRSHEASARDIMIATLVSSSKLTDLFGAYRIMYSGISTLRTTIEGIGLKALHSLRADR